MYQEVLCPSLFNLLRGQGVFPLHAAAVALDQKGLIIAGNSGQGKSTLLLHLLKEEMQYMGDDTVLLKQQSECPEMLAFPTAIKITERTAQFFPEVSTAIREMLPGKGGKYRLDMPTNNNKLALSAKPALLILPEITANKETTIHPISHLEAAMQCIPQNTFVTENEVCRNNFDVLSQLVKNVKCYRVRLGQDMNSIGRQLVDVLCSV